MRESVIYQEILAEGETKGEAKGKQLALLAVAGNMLAQGMTLEQITTLTGLEPSQINALQQT